MRREGDRSGHSPPNQQQQGLYIRRSDQSNRLHFGSIETRSLFSNELCNSKSLRGAHCDVVFHSVYHTKDEKTFDSWVVHYYNPVGILSKWQSITNQKIPWCMYKPDSSLGRTGCPCLLSQHREKGISFKDVVIVRRRQLLHYLVCLFTVVAVWSVIYWYGERAEMRLQSGLTHTYSCRGSTSVVTETNPTSPWFIFCLQKKRYDCHAIGSGTCNILREFGPLNAFW